MAELPQGGGGTIPYGKASPFMVNIPPHNFHDEGTNTMADIANIPPEEIP